MKKWIWRKLENASRGSRGHGVTGSRRDVHHLRALYATARPHCILVGSFSARFLFKGSFCRVMAHGDVMLVGYRTSTYTEETSRAPDGVNEDLLQWVILMQVYSGYDGVS